MKILSASQLKQLDQFALLSEAILSVELMERAAKSLLSQIMMRFSKFDSFLIFCGPGNNGGDGLALARHLALLHKKVKAVVLQGKYTDEFILNLNKLKNLDIEFVEIVNEEQIEAMQFDHEDCIIDAIFGIGLSRPLENLGLALVQKINTLPSFKIAIDLPSGLSSDGLFESTLENTVLANYTLSIHLPKLAFLFPENNPFVGHFECVKIGIEDSLIQNQNTTLHYLDSDDIRKLIKPRPTNGHKGTFGHALIIAGSKGKIGASILSSKAALKTGCGLVTAYVPEEAVTPLLCVLPEAMIQIGHTLERFKQLDLTSFDAIGYGPGLGFEDDGAEMLSQLLNQTKLPLIIDADGLTLLSRNPKWYSRLNSNILLTPHPGEFDRLTQIHKSSHERFKTQLNFSRKYQVNVLLKGQYTSITTPDGMAYFNSTGNNGMATAGSGDVLTGIITSLCAQGYSVQHAALLGAYLHGFAGDAVASKSSRTSMIASEIIDGISVFFKLYEK
ncbi:MAG: NAD(P)H-hydrate dehydratase [Bacteroidetes bacterium]|nr:NAD(P)H-hydrate dehydratase [Bacteroidota bacterium]